MNLGLQMAEPNATLGAQHRTLANKGNEAMAYLQFILDYWERLPASIAFIHGHRCRGCSRPLPVLAPLLQISTGGPFNLSLVCCSAITMQHAGPQG